MFSKRVSRYLRINSIFPFLEADYVFTLVKLNSSNQSSCPETSQRTPEGRLSVLTEKLPLNTNNTKSKSNPAYYEPVHNVAAYVNKSTTLQEFIKLGVDLNKIERSHSALKTILRLDFTKDVKKYIKFLHDAGVSVDDLGIFITKNPLVFKEDIDNLRVRLNYLESKAFSPDNIGRIISKNPQWLSFATREIDDRLGYFQNKFELTGNEVRYLTVKMPKIITSDLKHIEETYFSVKEEMGFHENEIKSLVLNKPKIFTLNRKNLINRFCYLHSTMGLDHKHLINQPGILMCRLSRMKERYEFLKALDRAQFNPEKDGYISPLSIVTSSDSEFCSNICKVSVTTYNKFLKTLC